jgi:outer membrane protein TolC
MFSTAVSQPLLTLERAIALGLKNNYDIQIARNQVRISENNRGKGLAGLLPTLDASGGISRTNSEKEENLPPTTSDTDIDTWNANLTLNWTLFDGFRMFVNRAKFNELAQLGSYQSRSQIEQSVVDISKSYFSLVLQEQLLQVARDTRDISETRLSREKIRNQLGGTSTTDFLKAQVAFNADQSSLLDQELQVLIARKQLNILLGQNPETEIAVNREITVPELTTDDSQLLDLAMRQNSSLTAATLNKRIADRDVQGARSLFFPRVTSFASYGYNDQTLNSNAGLFPGQDVGTQTTSSTIGLALSFNLFNGRRDRIELQNAKIEANNQSLALRDARNRLAGLVQETLNTYRQRMEVVALEEQNIRAAHQNLDLQRERLQSGIANSLDFRDAQVSLTQAQTSLIVARYQARISHIEIEQLTGVLKIE